MRVQSEKTLREPKQPFASSVPPSPAEERAAAAGWQRRGLLGRLVRTS